MTLEHPTQQSQSRHPTPTPPKTHRRTQLIVDAFTAAVCELWGTTKTRRNHTVIAIVEALAGLPTFAAGGRAAYPAEKLAQRYHRHVRTIEDAVAKLREFPELVHVVLVRKGEPDWRGTNSRRAHLEFQLGPVLCGLLEHPCPTGAESIVPGVTAGPSRREAGNTPGLTPADLNLAQPTDLELKLKREPVRDTRKDQLNFEDQLPGPIPTHPPDAECSFLPPIHTATHHPDAASPLPSAVAEQPTIVDSDPPVTTRAPAPLAASCTEPPAPPLPALALARGRGPAPLAVLRNARPLVPITSRGSGSCNRRPTRLAPGPGEQPLELQFPCWLLDAIIRQHRTIAEGKGPYVPIVDRDRARVDGALSGLPGRWEDNALLELCARVSGCALGDARAKGGTAANLRYTFGGPDAEPDEPHKHFHRRVAELRENDEKAVRQRLDGELTAVLLGTPKPPKTSTWQRSCPPSSVTSTTSPGSRAQPSLTPAQQAALNAEYSDTIRRKLGVQVAS